MTSKHEKPAAPRSHASFAVPLQASVWITPPFGRDPTAYRFIQATFRTSSYLLLPWTFFLSIPHFPTFTLDALPSSIAAPLSLPLSTHSPSHTSLPFSKCLGFWSPQLIVYCCAGGNISTFMFSFSPLQLTLRRILVSYYLSPVFRKIHAWPRQR